MISCQAARASGAAATGSGPAGRVLAGATVDVLPDVVKVIALAQGRDYRQPATRNRGHGTAALTMIIAWCMGVTLRSTMTTG